MEKLNEKENNVVPTRFSDTETFISKEAAEILREFK